MRPSIAASLAVCLLSPLAIASPRGGGSGGGGGGGGPLHSTSTGLGGASTNGSSRPSGSSDPVIVERQDVRYVEVTESPGDGSVVMIKKRRVNNKGKLPTAHFEGYAGAQKVKDSDGSWSAELTIEDDWFRVTGAMTRYYELQPGASALTLTMPQLTMGFRVHDHPSNQIWLVGGLVGAKTAHDPVMDSSFVGVVAGVHVETPLSEFATLVGDAQVMQFEDSVTATAVKAGVKVGPVVASMRVLDFNVGPPLWGPELGLGF